MVFSKFTEFCDHHHNITLEHFHLPKRPCIQFSVNPYSRLHSQANTNLCLVSVDLPFLDILYKWNHTICSLFFL